MASAGSLTDGIKYIRGDLINDKVDEYFKAQAVDRDYFEGKDDVKICRFDFPITLSTLLLDVSTSILVKVVKGNAVAVLQFSVNKARLYIEMLCSAEKDTGFGSELLNIIKECIRSIQPNELKLISLLTDSEHPYLVEYYTKRGFKKEGSYLIWEPAKEPAAGAGTAGGRRRRKSRKSRKSRRTRRK